MTLSNQNKSLSKLKGGEFNLLKAFVILGLPLIHLYDEFIRMNIVPESSVSNVQILDILVVFGPSVFMICMGYAMATQRSYKRLLQTGIQFLLIQFLLNIFRFVIPNIPLLISGDCTWSEMIILCLESDIYMFVALFFIEYALLKKAGLSLSVIIIVCMSTFLLNDIIQVGPAIEETWLTALLGNFITLNEHSCFPLSSWSIIPVLGITIGIATRKFDLKKYNKTILHVFIWSTLVFIISILTINYYIEGGVLDTLINYGWYLILKTPALLLIVSLSFVVIAFTNFLYMHIKENFIERFLMKFSSVIMTFYIIHWILVEIVSVICFFIVEPSSITFWQTFIMANIIMIISVILSIKFGFTIMRFLLKITNYTKLTKKLKQKEEKHEKSN